MHIVVVGCGRVGSELAVSLEAEGHTVAIIDKNRNAFRRLPERFTGRAVLGFGFDRDHLEQAGIREAEALAAVTSGDNSNILTARIARETFEIPNVVARIYDPRRAAIYQRLGIPTVATVAWTTDQVLARVMPPEEALLGTIGSGDVVAIGVEVPEAAAGARISDINIPGRILVTAVTRFGQTQVAEAGTIIQERDFLNMVVLRSELGTIDAHLAGLRRTGSPGKARALRS